MNDNLTHISIVVDRSGSMNVVRQEAENAINHFLTEQKNQPGECTLLLVDFDSVDPHRKVFDGTLADAPQYLLDPRSMTPLLDAVGWTINETGKRLSALDEADRPSKVVVVIQTDGGENASREFDWEKVKAMVTEQTDTYNWQFVFLGMGLDTFKQGHMMGVQNVLRADANNAISNAHTHSVMSAYTTQYRNGTLDSMARAGGTHVHASGRVIDKDGHEIDPKTGERVAASN